jgi:hypothetical protein
LYDDAEKQLLPIEREGIQIPPNVISGLSGQDANTTRAYTSYVDIVMSEALRLGSAVDTTTPLLLRIRYVVGNSTEVRAIWFLAKARAMLSGMGGFLFSEY